MQVRGSDAGKSIANGKGSRRDSDIGGNPVWEIRLARLGARGAGLAMNATGEAAFSRLLPRVPPSTMPELYAAVADRAAMREAVGTLFWGVASIVIGVFGLPGSPLGAAPIMLGLMMAAIGVYRLVRRSLTIFAAAGYLLAAAGTWLAAVVFIRWALGDPVGDEQRYLGGLGLVQLIWAYGSFTRGNHWRSVLGGISTEATREARLFLAWLRSAPAMSPHVVALSYGRFWWRPVFGRARAYVSLHDVLVVSRSGFKCFALSFQEAERALQGEGVWDSTGIERRLSVKQDQAEKMRGMMAAAMPTAIERPATSC